VALGVLWLLGAVFCYTGQVGGRGRGSGGRCPAKTGLQAAAGRLRSCQQHGSSAVGSESSSMPGEACPDVLLCKGLCCLSCLPW